MAIYRSIGWGIVLATLASGVGLGKGDGIESRAMAETGATWYNCSTREAFTPEKQAWCDRWQTLQEGSFIVPLEVGPDSEYASVTLENGNYEQADGPLVVVLADEENWMAFGDINGDGKDDAAAILGVLADDSTLTTYLTAVLDIDGEAQALLPVALGERIALNGPITIANNRVTVPLLTQMAVINQAYTVEGEALTPVARLPVPEILPTAIPNGTLLFSQTADYAVRVFTENEWPRINLFNKTNGLLAAAATTAIMESSTDGITFSSIRAGDAPAVRVYVDNSGTQTLEVDTMVLQDYGQVKGTVTYLPRLALPPNAVIEVFLEDVSRADAPTVTLASQTLVLGDRQVPVPFQLVYDPAQIDPRFTYAVRARITVDGALQFTTTTQTAVITRGNPSEVEVLVDPVSR